MEPLSVGSLGLGVFETGNEVVTVHGHVQLVDVVYSGIFLAPRSERAQCLVHPDPVSVRILGLSIGQRPDNVRYPAKPVL